MTEGKISYKLRFPFNEFVNVNTPKGNKALPHELAESLKNQGLAKISASPIQAGWQDSSEQERKSAQLYCIFVNHRLEILEMKEQVQMIRSFLAA